jgi:pullulanase/glycogen debranching enzyme
MEKQIILRRLKTKDGIVSDIQELPEYRSVEHRAEKTNLRMKVNEIGTFPDGYTTWNDRTYRERRRYSAILIEMEEE